MFPRCLCLLLLACLPAALVPWPGWERDSQGEVCAAARAGYRTGSAWSWHRGRWSAHCPGMSRWCWLLCGCPGATVWGGARPESGSELALAMLQGFVPGEFSRVGGVGLVLTLLQVPSQYLLGQTGNMGRRWLI